MDNAIIKVIGVGGAGGNAINNMIDQNLEGVNFIVANTDSSFLDTAKAPVLIQMGKKITQGLGAGGISQKGKEAALESADEIRESLKDCNMVFIAAGMGGGTGTGAAPVIAEISKELGALTVAVVTRPFSFEGKKRAEHAEEGLEALRKSANTVITIPNDRLRTIGNKETRMIEMFRKADEVLYHSVKGIVDLIFKTGYINLDFADVKTIMSRAGVAIIGIGVATGKNRGVEAAQKAISHPLLEDISIKGAKAILMNITANSEVNLDEVMEASDYIHKEAGDEAEVIWGAVFDDSVGDEMRITVIGTGIGTSPDIIEQNKIISPMFRPHKFRNVIQENLKDDSKYDNFNKKNVGNSTLKGMVIDNNLDSITDLDIPTFLRRKS